MAYVEYSADEVRTIIRKLETAWVTGIRSVQFADRGTIYIDQYEERIGYFKRLLTVLIGKRSRQTQMIADKGF